MIKLSSLAVGSAAAAAVIFAAASASAAVITFYDTGVPTPSDVLNVTGGLTGGDTQINHGAFTDSGVFVVSPGSLLTSYNITTQRSGTLYTITGGTMEIYENGNPIADTLVDIGASNGHYLSVGSDDFTLGAGTYTVVVKSVGLSPIHTASNRAYSTYSIELQGSPAAAPEPASWALMLVGFGGVGATLRVARRKSAAIAA